MQKYTNILLIFLCITTILTAGCTSSTSTASAPPPSTPLTVYTTVLVTPPAPTVMNRNTTIPVSTPDTIRTPTKTQTPKPTITFTGTPAITPSSVSFFCNGDSCGTLDIQLTCNPKILFRRVAIVQINDLSNTTERSAAVASMGNNFVDIFPDGSVSPVKLTPGSYSLVLLDAKNVQVPESRIYSSMKSVYVTKNKITKVEFKEECR